MQFYSEQKAPMNPATEPNKKSITSITNLQIPHRDIITIKSASIHYIL